MPSSLPANTNRGPMLLGVIWAETCLAMIFVTLRIVSRTHPSNALGWDDYTIVMATISTTVGSALITTQVHAGYGTHVYYLSKNQIMETAKWTTTTEIQSIIGVYFVKISVCFFILRILSGTNKVIRRTLIAFMIILSFLMVANVLLLCLQCIPIQGIWDPAVAARCVAPSDLDKVSKAFSAFGVFTDFLCVLIPIFILQGLQMSPRTKIATMVILGLGVFTAACSITKTVLIQVSSEDLTWELVPVEIWASLEENLGIIIASVPAIRRLFASMMQKVPPSARSYLSTAASYAPFVRRNRSKGTRTDSDVDQLVSKKGIHVMNTLELQTRARRPSNTSLTLDNLLPVNWKQAENMTV